MNGGDYVIEKNQEHAAQIENPVCV